MREIKFRAWVKPIQIFANRQYGYMIDVSVINFEEKWVSDDEETVYEFHEIELMQYTGLKDSNGVEIYEGDILQSEHYFKYQVVFKGDCWRCESLKNNRFKNRFIGRDLKVIGNIYENPELLEVEQ